MQRKITFARKPRPVRRGILMEICREDDKCHGIGGQESNVVLSTIRI